MITDLVSIDPLSGLQMTVVFLCLHMAEGARMLSGVSFRRTLIPSCDSTFMTQSPPDTIKMGIRFQYIHFSGHMNILSIAP